MTDRIELTDFSLNCIVGLLDSEQRTPQRLDIEVRLELDLDGAAGGDLSASVDYAAVAEQVRFIAASGRWFLLESLASAVCAHLLAPPAPGEGRAAIDVVEIGLRKPEILGDLATPAVTVRRASGWRTLSQWRTDEGGTVSVLQETPRTGAYRVFLPKGIALTLPDGSQSVRFASHHDEGESHLVVSRPPWAR